jgi:hypothetical protein
MRSPVPVLAVVAAAVAVAGCGSSSPPAPTPTATIPASLIAQRRPIGVGPRFQPPTPNRPVRDCRPALGPRDGAHVELFARNRVVLLPRGIGTRAPRTLDAGRIATARCYGPLVTLEPTGLALVRRGTTATLSDLFATWGAPLSAHRAASFRGPVAVFVGGRRVRGAPGAVALRRHAVIVIEVGGYIPPHRRYAFPPGS